jgi:hypothetical protein
MPDLTEHYKKLTWLKKLYSEEIDSVKKDNFLDNDFELSIKLTAAEVAQDEVLKHIKKEK